ncbi:hypothetical protein ACROYT_G037318 [Oculina patagonica]
MPQECIFFFLNRKLKTDSAADSTMNHDQKYRIWSVARQKFLKIENDKTSITCTGIGDEDGTGTEGSCILTAKEISRRHKTLWQFVFEFFCNGTKKTYALGNTFTAFEVAPNNQNYPVTGAATLMPDDLSGPFKALKNEESDQYIAANIKDGSLSLTAFDPKWPHPGTFFVISEI